MKRPCRIANASGFFGDRASALREVVEGGPVDVVTGDYLAELTMMILARQRRRDPEAGYAASFLAHIEPMLGLLLERGIKVVVNAGGLNPEGLARALRARSARLGLSPSVAAVLGGELTPRLRELQQAGHALANQETGQPLPDPSRALTASAYLGGWGIARALAAGADVVVCPRVTDASLVVGPAAWWHGWARDDWDRLAGAVAAGHVLECGPQATGGNYSSFREIADLRSPGFPLAEIADDGSSVITKHPGTGGRVSVGTVTAQLVYEIAGPRYLNPDVTARLDSIQLDQVGPDRVALRGARGEPPSPCTRAGLSLPGGFRNEMTFVLTGLAVDAKAHLFEDAARGALAGLPLRLEFQRIGAPDPGSSRQDLASALLRVVASSDDAEAAGRLFSGRLIELALSSYPGLFATAPPSGASEVACFWPALLPQHLVDHDVLLPDGSREAVALPPLASEPPAQPEPPAPPAPPPGPRRLVPLGAVADARSGDKGSDASLGVWTRSDEAFRWLAAELTAERLRELLPEIAPLVVERHPLPNLRALLFVVRSLMPGGAAATTRFDRQAKALGEFLLSRPVEVPEGLTQAPT